MKISQREARRLRARVIELERMEAERRNSWHVSYPGGVNIVSINVTSDVMAAIKTARKLAHAVVATHEGDATIRFYALPLAHRDTPERT